MKQDELSILCWESSLYMHFLFALSIFLNYSSYGIRHTVMNDSFCPFEDEIIPMCMANVNTGAPHSAESFTAKFSKK